MSFSICSGLRSAKKAINRSQHDQNDSIQDSDTPNDQMNTIQASIASNFWWKLSPMSDTQPIASLWKTLHIHGGHELPRLAK